MNKDSEKILETEKSFHSQVSLPDIKLRTKANYQNAGMKLSIRDPLTKLANQNDLDY